MYHVQYEKFLQIAVVVKENLTKFVSLNPDIEFSGEPGRFFAASAFHLCTNVIGRRKVTANKITNERKFIVVNLTFVIKHS